MAVHYKEGEIKKRPGIYQRQTNIGSSSTVGGRDGICAIPVRATWGPLGKVVRSTSALELRKIYGAGVYGTKNTVPAAEAMLEGGASAVYTYRLGTGGTAATKEITDGLTVTAKYVGTMPISVAVQEKLGNSTKKQFLVYSGTTLMETWEFSAGSKEGEALIEAVKDSNYVVITGETAPATVPVLAVSSGTLEGGVDPTVANADYSTAFAAMEQNYYNTIALDVDDDESMSLSLLLQSYIKNANQLGKNCMAVVGEKSTVDFETRLTHASSFNDALVVYLGHGYVKGTENRDGVLGICYTAGKIAATPSNQSITHTVIDGGTELCESLTYAQYEAAIDAGVLLLSKSADGAIWYDSGINTLVNPEVGTQDDGWKKIRRTKVRLEMFDRLDRALAPKAGKISADSEGVADIIQTGQRVLNAMADVEGKLKPNPKFIEDPENPMSGDSGWFVIDADDLDSLEKIYLHYHFRKNGN